MSPPSAKILTRRRRVNYKQTEYKNLVLKSGNSIFHAKWTSDFLLHAVRIVGNEKISRQRIVKPFIDLSTAAVASYFDYRRRPLINCVSRILRIHQWPNRRFKWSMKTSDDLRPPSSIYSHSYKFLYKQTGYRIFILKFGNSLFYAKWNLDSLLHAVRIVGNE